MTAPQAAGGRPSPAEVRAIATAADPVVRNLRITECYHRISAAFRTLLDDGANWCTFATWASRQAGRTIRGEDFGDRLADVANTPAKVRLSLLGTWRRLLRRGLFRPETRLGRLVREIHSPFDAFERASEAVAAGNRKVFEEIGFEMARYLEERGDIGRFLEGLRPGPPPEGQDLLRRAFGHYEAARSEARPAWRAQLMLLANLEIGFHEQTRLQPEIRLAMEAGPETAEDLKARSPLLRPLAPLLRSYGRFSREATRRAISAALMVLRLPGRTLALGRNLEAETPAVLAALEEPELTALIRPFEPEGGCGGCGARDWAELGQRMHYIFHLFRAFHADPELFREPFSPGQAEAIRGARLPDGEL